MAPRPRKFSSAATSGLAPLKHASWRTQKSNTFGRWLTFLGSIRAFTIALDMVTVTPGSTSSPRALNALQLLSLLTPHNQVALSSAIFPSCPSRRLTCPSNSKCFRLSPSARVHLYCLLLRRPFRAALVNLSSARLLLQSLSCRHFLVPSASWRSAIDTTPGRVPPSAPSNSNVLTTLSLASAFASTTVSAQHAASSAFPQPTPGLLPLLVGPGAPIPPTICLLTLCSLGTFEQLPAAENGRPRAARALAPLSQRLQQPPLAHKPLGQTPLDQRRPRHLKQQFSNRQCSEKRSPPASHAPNVLPSLPLRAPHYQRACLQAISPWAPSRSSPQRQTSRRQEPHTVACLHTPKLSDTNLRQQLLESPNLEWTPSTDVHWHVRPWRQSLDKCVLDGGMSLASRHAAAIAGIDLLDLRRLSERNDVGTYTRMDRDDSCVLGARPSVMVFALCETPDFKILLVFVIIDSPSFYASNQTASDFRPCLSDF